MINKLLSEWENRQPSIWNGDKLQQFNGEIAILQSLQKCGCTITNDGLSIQMQLDERRAIMREIIQMQHGA
jgi:hypothetical protein